MHAKDLGAYSPREIHMRKPMSAHELYNCALIVGMPLSNAGNKMPYKAAKLQTSLRQPREGKRLTREYNTLYETNVSQS